MNMSMVPAKNSSSGSSRTTGLACVVVVLAALAVYYNSFSGPFIYDDLRSTTQNPTIRHLWPVWRVLSPPASLTVGGRPLVNLSLALNYALSGDAVWSYHALNLLIHVLAGLALFGLVRRTLLRQGYGGQALASRLAARRSEISNLRFEISEASLPLAFAVALLWVVHPLQTECVTYIIQRAESLMGLFYLLTLYCFVRGVDETGERQEARGERKEPVARSQEKHSGFRPLASNLWPLASVFFCLLGMASKEVMVSAPLMVLLYDRTFVAGSFRVAWQQRRKLYLGLSCTWLLLGYLMVATGSHGGTVNFGSSIPAWAYALTQFRAIAHYLRLSVWPHPLVFDYGVSVLRQVAAVLPYAAVVVPLVALTAAGLWRNHPLGFLGAWFFLILAPSSSVLPLLTETMAEHRMYLPLASVITLAVVGLYGLIGRRSLMVLVAAAVGLGWLTIQRNKDYQSDLAIWTDTVVECPGNARARNDLGDALVNIPGRQSEAISAYEAALQIDPDSPLAHNNLGCALGNIPGRLPEAIVQFETAFRIEPGYVVARNNLGITLYKAGRTSEAIVQFKEAIRIKPDYAEAHYNLGVAFDKLGRISETISQFEEAVRIDPDYAEAHYSLGTSLARRGQIPEAVAQLQEAVRIKPDYMEAHRNLGIALAQAGQIPEAMAQCQEVLRIRPDSPDTRALLEKLQNAAK
jgi:tetratricopeptide (TPR) repeat protein